MQQKPKCCPQKDEKNDGNAEQKKLGSLEVKGKLKDCIPEKSEKAKGI